MLVGLPGTRTPSAVAAGSDECTKECYEDYKDALVNYNFTCRNLYTDYDPRSSVDLLFHSPFVGEVYGAICNAAMARWLTRGVRQCVDNCLKNDKPTGPKPLCGGGQKGSRANGCIPLPPPPPALSPPTPPPPPPPSEACANCQSVGGTCCGSNADGSLCACGCATCDCCVVYGCCS
jgi:hypothetical protein